MKPRVLVVRSGDRPFFSGDGPPGLEVRERVSHAIVPCLEGEAALDGATDMAIFTSRIAAERLLGDPGLASRLKSALASGRVLAVGTATGEALARAGLRPHEVGEGSAASLSATTTLLSAIWAMQSRRTSRATVSTVAAASTASVPACRGASGGTGSRRATL